MSSQGTFVVDEHNQKLAPEDLNPSIKNSTGEKIIVYGPKRATEAGDYAYSWYILHPDQTSPNWWECGGIFVPTDRSFTQGTTENVKGPLAVRYSGSKCITVTKDGDRYIVNGDPNNGVFHRTEIDWSIPEFSAEDCQNMTRSAYEIPKGE